MKYFLQDKGLQTKNGMIMYTVIKVKYKQRIAEENKWTC